MKPREYPRDWRQSIPRSIHVVGWLSLLFGICFGGLQTLVQVAFYDANARGVTLDCVYAIFFLWCFWGAVSIGYIVSAMLAKYDCRSGIIAASVFALGHVSAIALIIWEMW